MLAQGMQKTASAVRIEALRIYEVRLPLWRIHKLAMNSVSVQTNIVIELIDDTGQVGWGEVGTMPAYGTETAETVAAVLTRIFAPAVLGEWFVGGEELRQRLDRLIRGNANAKSGLCLALDDVVAKRLGIPLSRLWGERRREGLPVTWVLGSGEADQEAEEARSLLEQGRFRSFMLKLGRHSPAEDLARVTHVVEALGTTAEVRVDINQSWNLSTALRYVPALSDIGVRIIEQPLAADDLAGMARLDRLCCAIHVADEAVQTPADVIEIARRHASRGISVKIAKHGCAGQAQAVGHIASAAGIDIFAGTMFESSLGIAAHAQLFATFENLNLGSQFFGPQLMREEIVRTPITYKDFGLILPEGPGIGVEVDPDRLREFGRELR